jgi:hypothetical protein
MPLLLRKKQSFQKESLGNGPMTQTLDKPLVPVINICYIGEFFFVRKSHKKMVGPAFSAYNE